MDRGASILREPSPPNSDCETEIVSEEDQGNDSDGGASDVSVVKIMSDDPMAAARAAAILKMVRMVHSLLIIFSLTGMNWVARLRHGSTEAQKAENVRWWHFKGLQLTKGHATVA